MMPPHHPLSGKMVDLNFGTDASLVMTSRAIGAVFEFPTQTVVLQYEILLARRTEPMFSFMLKKLKSKIRIKKFHPEVN